MKFLIALFTLVTLCSCGPTTTTTATAMRTPMPKNFSPTLNDASKNLLTHQQNNFDRILDELRTQQKKTSHWIWWVFPTEHPGNSEPSPSSRITVEQVDHVLAHADLKKWTTILTTIATLLENHPVKGSPSTPNDSIIPSIDHGRIAHSLQFWLQKAGDKTKKHHDFFQAWTRIDKFKWR